MKKILFFASALAGLFLAGSCQREKLESYASGSVTYTITLPETVQTKGDGGYAEYGYDLYYEVYKTVDAAELEEATPLFEKMVTFSGSATKIPLELLNDQDYTILFWANKKGQTCFNTEDLRNVKMLESASNNENRDAFCGMDEIVNQNGTLAKTVELKRPFAQLNIATILPSDNLGYDVELRSSMVKVKYIPVAYNVATAEPVGEDVEVTYTDKKIPEGFIATDYKKVAMNYLLVPEGTIDVYYEITTPSGIVKNTVPNVPVKANYRTNIIGNLITSNATYTVNVSDGFEDSETDNPMEVVDEGIVKNINGDYEISNAKGLAYAMNKLFVEGGNFYLTAAEYDMTGLQVTVPTIPTGVSLNIYGETPVVTRSATTLAGVTIKGLESLIGTVASGAAITISGVDMPTDGAVLIEKNDGTVAVSDCTVGSTQPSSDPDDLIGEGNGAVVNADAVADIATLNAALASGAKVINITADIEATEFIPISRSVTINGNDHKITSSATRIIRFQKNKDIEVVLNNLHGVSTAKFVYGNVDSVRGFSIDGEVHNMVFTLNGCSVDFTDPSATDCSYAINVVSSENNTIVINGGTYEGANVINVWGSNHNISIDGATLNCNYAYNASYFGACIRIENTNNKVTLKNSTFNGTHAVAISEGGNAANNEYILENNFDYTMYSKKSEERTVYYVASATKLQAAADMAAAANNVIVFTKDLAGNVTILQKDGINLEINGNGHKYDGTITIDGDNRFDGVETLTIANINFESATASPFISAPGSLNGQNERYSHNITVDGCTFAAPSYTTNVSGISAQKTYHLNVKNSSAKNIHSLLQVQSCDNDVTVDNVTVENCKSGISFGNTARPVLKNSTIQSNEYGVRADGDGRNCNLKIENTTVSAAQPVIVRKVNNASLTYAAAFENVTLNTDGLYQVVFTNGQDDADYVTPTGNFSITGADDLIVYPRDFAVTTPEELKAASKRAGNIYIMNDITVTADWSYRTDSEFAQPVTINGMGHTIKFTGNVYNPNNNNAFRFENTATVKNLTIDLSETPSERVRAISTKAAIVVDNCKFIGNAAARRGIIFGEGAVDKDFAVSISNSTFVDWARGITDNENANDIKGVTVKSNNFVNAPVYISAYEAMEFTENHLDNSLVNITSYTSAPTVKVKATGNTLDTSFDNIIGHPSRKFSVANVEAQAGFTVYAE